MISHENKKVIKKRKKSRNALATLGWWQISQAFATGLNRLATAYYSNIYHGNDTRG